MYTPNQDARTSAADNGNTYLTNSLGDALNIIALAPSRNR